MSWDELTYWMAYTSLVDEERQELERRRELDQKAKEGIEKMRQKKAPANG